MVVNLPLAGDPGHGPCHGAWWPGGQVDRWPPRAGQVSHGFLKLGLPACAYWRLGANILTPYTIVLHKC